MRPIITVTAAALAFSGCLSTAHRVPKSDLIALANLPPEARAKRVRAIQAWAGDEGPPPAPRNADAHVSVVVVDSGPHPAPRPSRPLLAAQVAKEDSKLWLIVAAAAAVTLAFTEGARYDGWVALQPNYPLHLYGPYGEYRFMPLSQLDPQTAAWTQRAYVREGEGAWTHLGRAPLNRVGFTYSLLVGSSEFPARGGEDPAGFLWHLQLGAFPAQEIGIQLDFGQGWTTSTIGQTVFDNRLAVELDVLPLSAGGFHAGAYGALGYAYRLEDGYHGDDDASSFYGLGALLQLELTTRLALTARAGMTSVYGERANEITGGLSIY